MYQAHYLTDKGIKSYLKTIDEELYRKHKQMYLNHDKHIDHAAALDSIKKIKGLIEIDKEYREYHNELCTKLMELYR